MKRAFFCHAPTGSYFGGSVEDRDTFFKDMTENEFYDYPNGLYNNDNNNLIVNIPFYENADPNSGVEIEAKRVKDVYSDNGKVEFINEVLINSTVFFVCSA